MQGRKGETVRRQKDENGNDSARSEGHGAPFVHGTLNRYKKNKNFLKKVLTESEVGDILTFVRATQNTNTKKEEH